MITLNEASDLLSKAELADAEKDYGAVNNYASRNQIKLNGLTCEAATLTQSIQSSASKASLFKILSLIISLDIVAAGIPASFVLNKSERRSNFGSETV